MAEWWNLDQALIWIATGDLEQVELAKGDAAGRRKRKHYYLGLPELGVEEAHVDDDTDDDQGGLGSFELLMSLLCEGKIAAVRAGDETGTLLPSSIFNEMQIGPNDAGEALIFRPSEYRMVAGIVREQEAALILLSRDDVLKWVPGRAPADLQAELSSHLSRKEGAPETSPEKLQAPETPAASEEPERSKRGRPYTATAIRAEALGPELFPGGFPSGRSKSGAVKEAFGIAKAQLRAEGLPAVTDKTLLKALRRASKR